MKFRRATAVSEPTSHGPPTQVELEAVSLATDRPRGWQADLSNLPRSFVRQILGLNPFKTSYFALYRPLQDWRSRCILAAAIIFAIAAGVPLPIIGVIFGRIIDGFPPSEEELATKLTQLLGVG